MVQVETVANVIELLQKYPEGYVIACYPACNRYAGVASGELVYIPLKGHEAKVNICLFYEKRPPGKSSPAVFLSMRKGIADDAYFKLRLVEH